LLGFPGAFRLNATVPPSHPRPTAPHPAASSSAAACASTTEATPPAPPWRLTLGCLLAAQLGLQLRRVGSSRRLTFADGEPVLSGWMGRHARVCWMPHPRPWEPEQALVTRLDLPLNLDGNAYHRFYRQLRELRAQANATARALPAWSMPLPQHGA